MRLLNPREMFRAIGSGRTRGRAGRIIALLAALLLAARELGADPGPLPYSGPGSLGERLDRVARESR